VKKTDADITGLVRSYASRNRLITAGDRVLAAVSGGPDSMALLHLLKELAQAMGFELRAAHLNHGLRGREAAGDAAFVKKTCRQWNIPLTTGKAGIRAYAARRKVSIETAAREVRRSFLTRTAARLKCDLIATGHTANDQAETVLMRLIRGSGLDGLTGIPVKNGSFIRPLLVLRRAQVIQYLTTNAIDYRNDSTNRSREHFRNRIRIELLPLLEKYNPRMVESLCRTAENLKTDQELIDHVAGQAMEACIKGDNSKIAIDLSEFKLYNKGLQSNVLRRAAEQLCGPGAVPDKLHLQKAVELLTAGRTGAIIPWSEGLWVRKEYSTALIEKKPGRKNQISKIKYQKPKTKNKKLRIPGRTVFREQVITASLLGRSQAGDLERGSSDTVYFDAGLLDRGGLEAGPRAEGERMIPFGQRSAKKIKQLFIDAKVPRDQRRDRPVVRQGGEILWLCGLRRSALYPVTARTKKVLCLRYTRK
jgi:tRNA(Ile)-lysidine synthase